MLAMVDETTLKAWTLLDMNRIPRWVNGRLALLGDAAHPFLPRKYLKAKEDSGAVVLTGWPDQGQGGSCCESVTSLFRPAC
jgi:hypothetical protein